MMKSLTWTTWNVWKGLIQTRKMKTRSFSISLIPWLLREKLVFNSRPKTQGWARTQHRGFSSREESNQQIRTRTLLPLIQRLKIKTTMTTDSMILKRSKSNHNSINKISHNSAVITKNKPSMILLKQTKPRRRRKRKRRKQLLNKSLTSQTVLTKNSRTCSARNLNFKCSKKNSSVCAKKKNSVRPRNRLNGLLRNRIALKKRKGNSGSQKNSKDSESKKKRRQRGKSEKRSRRKR